MFCVRVKESNDFKSVCAYLFTVVTYSSKVYAKCGLNEYTLLLAEP